MGRSRKDSHSPHRGNFCRPEEKKLFLIIVSVLGHPKGVGGLTSNFLGGGGMDVFWNDPISNHEIVHVIAKNFNLVNRAEFTPRVESVPCNRPLICIAPYKCTLLFNY
jgi:hypothetical protein